MRRRPGALVVLAVLSASVVVADAQPALRTRTLLGGLVEMLVPVDFQPMADELVQRKYPSAVDGEVRNLIVATPADDRLLLVTVNMTKALEDTWLETANRMIGSLVVRAGG